ncbi:MAG TPA: serine hydrolase [Longimicrobiaceae bacterium]|nr:serine hydrolase [Longimicrobiaceae bacterium]
MIFVRLNPASLASPVEGIGGVTVAAEVSQLLDSLQATASLPLLVLAELGPGAIRAAEAEAAGRLAAREARAAGVRLALVEALSLNSGQPSPLPLLDEVRSGESVAAYLHGIRAEGVLAGIEVFATAEAADSPPVLRWDLARLEAIELPTLRRAIAAGADALLLAPVALPAISGDTLPLPLSVAAVSGLLRRDLEWEGLVIADLEALAPGQDAGETAVVAVAAGVDVLLGVADPPAVIDAIMRAVESGRIPAERVEAAARRVLIAKERVRALPSPSPQDSVALLHASDVPPRAPALAAPAPALRRVPAEEVGMSEAALARVDATIRGAIEAGLFPGAALAVGRRGGLVRLRGYGRVGREPDAPTVDAEETLYDLASLTKVVGTTAAMMALVETGRIELDAAVRGYVPEFTGDGRDSVTVRHLLAHTAGLPAGLNLYGRATSPEDALRQVIAGRLVLRPGEVALYSDLGMILLAEVVRRAAGEPLDRFLAWRVFAPLGMSSTMFLPPLAFRLQTPPSALTSERDFVLRGVVHDGNAFRLGGVAGHAGLFSSARDLAVFSQMLLNRGAYGEVRLFAPTTVTTFTTRQRGAGERALGWDTPGPESSAGSYFSAASFGHTGYTGTSIWIDPTRDLFVVLLTNRTYDRTPVRRMLEIRREIHDGISRAVTDLPLVRRPGAIERITPPLVRPPAPAPPRTPPPRSPRARRP